MHAADVSYRAEVKALLSTRCPATVTLGQTSFFGDLLYSINWSPMHKLICYGEAPFLRHLIQFIISNPSRFLGLRLIHFHHTVPVTESNVDDLFNLLVGLRSTSFSSDFVRVLRLEVSSDDYMPRIPPVPLMEFAVELPFALPSVTYYSG